MVCNALQNRCTTTVLTRRLGAFLTPGAAARPPATPRPARWDSADKPADRSLNAKDAVKYNPVWLGGLHELCRIDARIECRGRPQGGLGACKPGRVHRRWA